jgi:hypothetical protein
VGARLFFLRCLCAFGSSGSSGRTRPLAAVLPYCKVRYQALDGGKTYGIVVTRDLKNPGTSCELSDPHCGP